MPKTRAHHHLRPARQGAFPAVPRLLAAALGSRASSFCRRGPPRRDVLRSSGSARSSKNREVTAILAENSDLRSRAALTNARLESLEKQLAEFEDRTRRLSIVAGLSAVRDPGTGGVGGLTAAPIDPAASVGHGPERGRPPRSAPLVAPPARREAARAAGRPARPHADDRAGRRRPDGRLRPARPTPSPGHPEFHPGIDISTPAGQPRRRPGVRHRREGRLGQGLRPLRPDRPRLRRDHPVRAPPGGARRRGPARQARRPRRPRRLHGPLDRARTSTTRCTSTASRSNPLDYVLNAF